jgi:hypothetical protein
MGAVWAIGKLPSQKKNKISEKNKIKIRRGRKINLEGREKTI